MSIFNIITVPGYQINNIPLYPYQWIYDDNNDDNDVFYLREYCMDVIVETAIKRWIQQHRGEKITKTKLKKFIETYIDIDLTLIDEDLELYDDFDIEFNQPKTLVDLATSQLYPQVIKGWQQSMHNYTLNEYLASLNYRLAEKECILKEFKLNRQNNKKIFIHLPI